MVRATGPLAIIHPFPVTLDGLVAGALTVVAGGAFTAAIAAGLAMVLVQAAIGITNDVVDRSDDAVAKPWKPLPSRAITLSTAGVAAAAAGASGLGVALAIGPAVAVVAAAGLATGLAYDAWLKRTAWSWLPFAVGLSLVPAYAWLAARGTLPTDYAVVPVLGLLAGLLVSLSNGLVDLGGDTATGRGGLAVRLGRVSSLRLLLAVDVAFVVLAALTAGRRALDVAGAGGAGVAITAGYLAGAAAMFLGLALSGSALEDRRERGWELQAVAVALVAVAWLALVVPG